MTISAQIGIALTAAAALAACSTAPASRDEPVARAAPTAAAVVAPPLEAPPKAAAFSSPPTVSTDGGARGEVVVLWPRVLPREHGADIRDLAANMQQQLVALAKATFPGVRVTARPEPQRVCPQGGCDAVALGAVLVHTNGATCAVSAFVAAPGRTARELVPWGDGVELKAARVPFRQPPEGALRVVDFQPCAGLASELARSSGPIIGALRHAFATK